MWTNSDPSTLEHCLQTYGFSKASTLDALGAEWKIGDAPTTQDKEHARIEEALTRIERTKNLPVGIAMRLQLIDRACLSLLDYVNPSHPVSVKHLALPIKMALDQRFAAPEVLLLCFTKMPLDPTVRWMVAASRLLWEVLEIPDAYDLLFHEKRCKHGRLNIAKAALEKKRIVIERRTFVCGDARIPVGWGWEFVKKGVLSHLTSEALNKLAVRRPATFGGIGMVHRAQHMNLLRSLPNYEASLMMRVWTGSLLTRERAYRVGRGEHQLCTCGVEQTVWHVLWECPDLPLVPPDLVPIARGPPSLSVALLLPFPSPSEAIALWKKACARARHIMSLVGAKEQQAERHGRREHDANGHMVITDTTGRYAYCCRCFVSRRIRDKAWIFQVRCPREGPGFVEGQELSLDGHDCVLKMARWKGSALRPSWVCKKCSRSAWATSGFRKACRG